MIEERNWQDILTGMLSQINDKYDTSQNSFIHQSLASASIEFEKANKELITVSKKFDFWNLSGEELDEGVFQRTGIERREALRAEGTVIFTGKEGTAIPVNTIIMTEDEVLYRTTLDAVIVNGVAEVAVVAVIEGDNGNVGPNRITYFKDRLIGITDVYNPKSTKGGRDLETDDDLKVRCDHHMKYPPKSGNQYHYEEWVSDIPEVYRVKAFRRWENRSTVRLVIIEDTRNEGKLQTVLGNTSIVINQRYGPASEEMLNTVRDFLTREELVPFDADVLLEPAKRLDLFIQFKPEIEEGLELVEVLENAHGIITEYLVNRVFGEGVISYARISSLLVRSPGIIDFADLKIRTDGIPFGTSNIELQNDQMLVLKEIKTI